MTKVIIKDSLYQILYKKKQSETNIFKFKFWDNVCVCVFNSNLRKLLLLVNFKAISRHSVCAEANTDEKY